MSLLSQVTDVASRFAGGVQQSARRAKLEGERRVLQRRHRAALEALGERTWELAADGGLTADRLGPELADVQSRLMEIDALTAELDGVRSSDEATNP